MLSCCCRCYACDMVWLVSPVTVLLCSPPPLGNVFSRHQVERRAHLVRELYEYRLVVDKVFDLSAEVSCQNRFPTIRTCTPCCRCCRFCLMLLSLLHQRNRRRFAVSISLIACCSTKLFRGHMHITYTVRTPSVLYVPL